MYVTSIYVRILMNLEFWQVLEKNHKIWNFIKILPVATELFHADGQKDGQKRRSLKVALIIFEHA